jgi:hypothetical protein
MATAANPIRLPDPRRVRRRHPIRLLAATSALLVVCLASSASAFAAPANDDLAAATVVPGLPFSDTVDMTDATIESDEPRFCYWSEQTVWYAFTPTHDGTVAVGASSPSAYTQITAYRADGSGPGGLSFLSCENATAAKAVFAVQAGTTYYLQASTLFGTGGTLRLSLENQPPPPNDHFADATPVGSVPYSGGFDLAAATVEENEAATCQGWSSQATAWYAFTPAESGSYIVGRSGYGPVSVYTGSSVSSAAQVSCGTSQTVFHADAGTTYHLQVGAIGGYGAQGELTVERAPDAQASFYYWPSDPSVFDTVSFYDASYDVAGIGSRRWRLGDGFTTTDAGFGHRFAADGSYTAKLDVTTTDGRTASTSQTVAVKTHDVAVASMTVPAQGRVGTNKQIAIGVNNSRYAEMVRVSILRSVAGGGFEEVGQVTQGVPARAVRRTTSFAISYTFSEQDAAFGKVTFQAVATTLTARDANPSDNTVIAPATKVKP